VLAHEKEKEWGQCGQSPFKKRKVMFNKYLKKVWCKRGRQVPLPGEVTGVPFSTLLLGKEANSPARRGKS